MRKLRIASAVIPMIVLIACSNAKAQDSGERLYFHNLEGNKVAVEITANDGQGNRIKNEYSLAPGAKNWVLLGPLGAGFQPFDIVVKEADGTVTAMPGVMCCGMMAYCKNTGITQQPIVATVKEPGRQGRAGIRTFNAAVAWKHVEVIFQRATFVP